MLQGRWNSLAKIDSYFLSVPVFASSASVSVGREALFIS
jgi:hypothetical protein